MTELEDIYNRYKERQERKLKAGAWDMLGKYIYESDNGAVVFDLARFIRDSCNGNRENVWGTTVQWGIEVDLLAKMLKNDPYRE